MGRIFRSIDDFAFSLEYLAQSVGTETPTQLKVIARALATIQWDIPKPEPLTANGEVYGFGECFAVQAIGWAEIPACEAFLHARKLLEGIPEKPVMRKMCYLHDAAERSRGYRLVAVRGNNGTAGFIENTTLGEAAAHGQLAQGWSCLFVRTNRADGSRPGVQF